jgi:hypothetical protein
MRSCAAAEDRYGQDVTKVWSKDVELGQQCELPPSNANLKVQFTWNRHTYSCRTCIEITPLPLQVCSAKKAEHCATWSSWLNHRCRRVRWCQKNYERSWVSSRLSFQPRECPRAESFSNFLCYALDPGHPPASPDNPGYLVSGSSPKPWRAFVLGS